MLHFYLIFVDEHTGLLLEPLFVSAVTQPELTGVLLTLVAGSGQ